MEITWYGHSCFRLAERGLAVAVTDPFDESVGYPVPTFKAGIVTSSHDAPGHSNMAAAKGAVEIKSPGEYEVGGVFVIGMAANHGDKRNTIFVFDYNGLTVCHLGDLVDVLPQRRTEALGSVDVLLVPVGGGGALSAAKAAEMISMLEPSIVIPMHYQTEQNLVRLESLGKFLKEMGIAKVDPQESLKITKDSLPTETQVIVLEAK